MASYTTLPADLPQPTDDGGADHLEGMAMPGVALPATTRVSIDFSTIAGRAVVYAYPMTGVPGVALPEGWNEIPGARGCTPQTLAFKDSQDVIEALGASVFGLSVQTPDYQRELSDRLGLSFPILSDAAFELTEALRLPTMTVDGARLLKRLTLIVRDGRIEHAIYPVFPPDRAADDVITWLRAHPISEPSGTGSAIVIYTLPDCPHCAAAKTLLDRKGVGYKAIDVGRKPDEAAKIMARTGVRTFPQIFAAGIFIGGRNDLERLNTEGRLEALLRP